MSPDIKKFLEKSSLSTSAPCRVDMGGTLDIKSIFLPMRFLTPVTFNLAVDLRTEVSLMPYTDGMVKISSRGFESVKFSAGTAPYHHPLGLMFAITDFFDVSGLHISINSASPPRSALGGSSAAAVALVCALTILKNNGPLSRKTIALTAHALEEAVARIPCGLQDQLASVYGGANAWYWHSSAGHTDFNRLTVLDQRQCRDFSDRFVIAYCGVPHESKNINSRWMRHFIQAEDRALWKAIVESSRLFVEALTAGRMDEAIDCMNRDSTLRKQMTPDVFDDMGENLVLAAQGSGCGVRFTGAGGGGCVWALGEPENIRQLETKWEAVLKDRKDARMLYAGIDTKGLMAPEYVVMTD